MPSPRKKPSLAHLHIRLPASLLEELHERAAASERTLAEEVRQMVISTRSRRKVA